VILNSIQHTARREHQCAFCGRTISVGERYVRDQVPGGGRVAKEPLHIKCYTGLLASTEKQGEQNVRNVP